MLLPKKKAQVTKSSKPKQGRVVSSAEPNPSRGATTRAEPSPIPYTPGTLTEMIDNEAIPLPKPVAAVEAPQVEVSGEPDEWPAPTPKPILFQASSETSSGDSDDAGQEGEDGEAADGGEGSSLARPGASASTFRLDFSGDDSEVTNLAEVVDVEPAAAPQKTEPVGTSAAEVGAFFKRKKTADSASSSGTVNKQFVSDYKPKNPGWKNVGTPEQVIAELDMVGYQCYHYLAVQLCLLLNTDFSKIRALLLEGPSGCGKSFMAKSLAKVCGAELMCLSCYKGMPTQNLIETPSTLAMVNAMAGKSNASAADMMNLGIISRAYLASQDHPVLLLIDELDKPDGSIDTFFLGPIQDARIWLESRPPIDANVDNLLMVFTKNWNRTLDEALLRRVHPIRMTYLDSTLERRILSPHCHPVLVDNIVAIADRMRNTGGSYAFERPPAPEELLTAGHYVQQLLEWQLSDFGFVGKNVWAILAKSEHDRAVLEHMMRFHPDFLDPLYPDGKNTPLDEIHAKLGRLILHNIVSDPRAADRENAWKTMEFN